MTPRAGRSINPSKWSAEMLVRPAALMAADAMAELSCSSGGGEANAGSRVSSSTRSRSAFAADNSSPSDSRRT
jgi:hypothetical protein